MTNLINSILAASIAASTLALAAASFGQTVRLRVHTVTDAAPMETFAADQSIAGGFAEITVDGDTRVITTNGIPTHSVGDFSDRPNQISAQDETYTIPANPELGEVTTLRLAQNFGVGVNGVPFDPLAAEFWQGDMDIGWQYEALGGAVPLGLDSNFAHVQPTGAYHYHGLPVGLLQDLGWSIDEASPLVGYAADGFPIYALTAEIDGEVKTLASSYQLQSGARPGGDAPGGDYDGAFLQDYVYVEGAGDLDECNGIWLETDAYPTGTYAYILTAEFPVIPRCFMGEPDASFGPERPAR